jgi:hypothetical protein
MERPNGDRRVLPRNGRQEVSPPGDPGHLRRRDNLFRNGSSPATAAAHASKMKDSAVFISSISCDQPSDGFEHLGSRIGLAEVSRTARSFSPCARIRIIVSGYVNERSGLTTSSRAWRGPSSPKSIGARALRMCHSR